ncbi:hypothetical protein K1719_021787 [Acacia pycnantha]|nr:hypothetical protein K1719_021787 [Acacia pycnantha]
MQTSLHTAWPCCHHLSWKHPRTCYLSNELILNCSKLFFKPVTAYSSLRTHLDSESDGGVEKGPHSTLPVSLPFVIRSPTKVSRRCCSVIRDFLIPQQVADSYMDYVRWKFLHRVFSSALQVLATQAMFKAIGVGHAYSLPSSAALNWVLKDGIGRLSRCIYTASLASAFDTNLKRVRFSTSIIFVASIGLELLTPAFPQCFLLLATIANIAKQISLACYLATRSAVHQSFAVADNLGEISAKAQIQTVCFDNLGLMLAALINVFFESYLRQQVGGLHILIYLIFAGMDLLGIYQGLKFVHLQTLTKDRLEIILNTWIESGYIPTPAEVSEKEGINILGIRGQESWRIRIGCLNSNNQMPRWSIEAMQRITGEDFYFICVEICSRRFKRVGQPGILLSFRDGAEAVHIIMGLLQACYIRKALIADGSRWENSTRESNESDSALEEWSMIIEDSKRSAKRDLSNMMEQILEKGWEVKGILLSRTELARFTFSYGY